MILKFSFQRPLLERANHSWKEQIALSLFKKRDESDERFVLFKRVTRAKERRGKEQWAKEQKSEFPTLGFT